MRSEPHVVEVSRRVMVLLDAEGEGEGERGEGDSSVNSSETDKVLGVFTVPYALTCYAMGARGSERGRGDSISSEVRGRK